MCWLLRRRLRRFCVLSWRGASQSRCRSPAPPCPPPPGLVPGVVLSQPSLLLYDRCLPFLSACGVQGIPQGAEKSTRKCMKRVFGPETKTYFDDTSFSIPLHLDPHRTRFSFGEGLLGTLERVVQV